MNDQSVELMFLNKGFLILLFMSVAEKHDYSN